MPQTDRTPADLVGSAAAILTGSLVALASSLAIRVVLARALSPADLGALLLAISIVSFAGVAASLGLRSATARRVSSLLAGGDRRAAVATSRTSLLTGLASGGVVTAAVAVAAFVPPLAGGKLPPALLAALTPAVVGLAGGTALWGISQGFGDSRGRALWRDSFGGTLRLAAIALAAVAGGGLLALAVGWALGSLLGESLFGLYGRRQGWFRQRREDLAGAPPPGRDRALLATLPPFAASTFLHQVVRWLDMLLVGLLAPLAVVALYGLAQSVYRVLGMVQGAAAHRFLPLASAAVTDGDDAGLARTYRQARDLTFRFLWLPLAACLLCPRELVVLAFGADYAGAGVALRLLAAALALAALCGYTEDLLYARGKPGLVFVRVAGVSVLAALLLVLLVPRWGATGEKTAGGLLAGTAFDVAMIGRRLRRAALGRPLLSPALVAAPAVFVAAALAAARAAGWSVPPLAVVASVTAAAAPPAALRLFELLPRGSSRYS